MPIALAALSKLHRYSPRGRYPPFRLGSFEDLFDLALALHDAWGMFDFPEMVMEKRHWVELFGRTGYISNGHRSLRPTEGMTLYRGCVESQKFGMSWTSIKEKAERFAPSPFNGCHCEQVFSASVEPERLYAYLNDSGEDTYVIETEGLAIERVACDSLYHDQLNLFDSQVVQVTGQSKVRSEDSFRAAPRMSSAEKPTAKTAVKRETPRRSPRKGVAAVVGTRRAARKSETPSPKKKTGGRPGSSPRGRSIKDMG
ncbi:hypothetical protein [Rhodococcus sp. BP22]|uniref:hypothetical protein n=1 Tax=Rhodococcus sp. BP22 TaxID=2758566 RepID=UPI001C938991